MSEPRRRRSRAAIHPLIRLDNFSAEQARRSCAPADTLTVSRMLAQLVHEGVLEQRWVGTEARYRWKSKPDPSCFAERWASRLFAEDNGDRGDRGGATRVSGRPRERLLRQGAAALSDAELIAVLIRGGATRESPLIGAQRIVDRLSDRLELLAHCSLAELREISSAATPCSYAQIMAGIELGRRVASCQAARSQPLVRITGTQDAVQYCLNRFARLASDGLQEEFHIVTLDTKHKPLHTHRITVGTLDASLVHPREVFRPAIRDAASAILLVHNHPSGDPTPSREDQRVTEQLTKAGGLLGIEVLDHIVVAREGGLSIRECS